MRTSFTLATLLFAIAAIAAPVADAEAGLEKRHYHQYQATGTAPAPAPTGTGSSGSSSSGDSSGLDSDEQSVLDTHNKYRSQHSADPLTWNSDLASYAASYASSCVFEHTGGNPIILT